MLPFKNFYISQDRLMFRIILIPLLLLLNACSANWPHALDTAVPDLKLGHPLSIRVVVRDIRPDTGLLPAEHAKKVIGQIKPVMSDPIPVLTQSGNSLAADVGSAICKGFKQHRWNCEAVETTFRGTVKDEIPFIVEGAPVDRILYVLISKYHSSVDTKTAVEYDLDVTIWNSIGNFLTATGEHGTIYLDTDTILNPAENASRMAPQALKEILSSILNAKPVRQSLTF